MENNELLPFNEHQIRKIWHNEQWFFSVIDVIEVLTDSPNPRTYWAMLKKRDGQLLTICEQLKMKAKDGRTRQTDCAHTEGMLRIIMAVPSPKAEPIKQWLAQVGRENIETFENPELGIDRIKEIYKTKGYSNEWIDRRMKSIEIRKELTEEWKKRGVKEGQEYSILTAEIAKATFGLTPSEHSQLKGLEKQNLRDHMTNFELIFTMLGEDASRQMAENDNAEGFNENHDAAQAGGKAAGRALKAFEEDKKIKVVSKDNFLHLLSNDSTKELPPTLPEDI